MGKKLLRTPSKLGFLAHKQPNLAQDWLFWPNIGILACLVPWLMEKQCEQGA